MSGNYTRDHLKISAVKILQTIGWNSINSTPLEILTDLLSNYVKQITKNTNNYANEFGCTDPSLDHLGLAFRDMGINISELEEYVKYVNFAPPPNPVPKYPISKEDHLNFLKPGSKEVVTRPVHIHEHLPPMNPLLEGNKGDLEAATIKTEELDESNLENSQVFKKPADISPSEFKRANFRREEEGSRPTREISSVMMTTSGFLSPAREGKLPESRTPVQAVDPVIPPNPPAEVPIEKKPNKVVKKVEKKKRVIKPEQMLEEKKKKMNSMKWMVKPKQAPAVKLPQEFNMFPPKTYEEDVDKALAAARQKTEKLNTTITPVTVKPATQKLQDPDNIDKLFTEPDKKKVNIFKKISNVKNEKDVKVKKDESRESSPDLIIDEPDEIVSKIRHISGDVTIEPINSVPRKSPEKLDATPFYVDEDAGIPSTPKTPEMISPSPPMIKEKRKRKESKKFRKVPKKLSPNRLDNDVIDLDMERPKTPEAQGLPKISSLLPPMGPMSFPFSFGGISAWPGLIPTPLLPTQMFPPLNFPPAMTLNHFGEKPPFLPNINPRTPKIEPPPPQNFNPIDDVIMKNPEKLTPPSEDTDQSVSPRSEKKSKEHKKDKKDKLKKRNKKDKVKDKAEKRKLKEEKKEKIKKEKREKRKDKELKEAVESPGVKITLKIKSPSPRPETPESRKLNIKPIVKRETEPDFMDEIEDRTKRETSPGLAKISALVFGPPKPKPVVPPPHVPQAFNDSFPSSSSDNLNQMRKTITKPIPKIRTKEIRREPVEVPLPPAPPSRYIDVDGNEVWICPACGRQDDGSPMIGCDGCDAWYHWVCVGIQVPPDDNEDWYCRHCLLKKNEDLQSDKQKKKRKKKEKKEN